MPVMVGNRKDVVRTKTGHTISFAAAGDEKFVPNLPELVKECTNRGHYLKVEPVPVAIKQEEKAGSKVEAAPDDKPVKKGPFGRPLKE